MAQRNILSAGPSFMDIRPNIIAPSAGDLEEARIRRSIDLAKLRELTLAPEFEQQRLNLTKMAQDNEAKFRQQDLTYRTNVLGETSTHNVAEEKHWADLLGLDQKKLQETARQHDTALSELTDYHKGILKNQLTEGFMAHLAPSYGADATAKVLEKTGLPELTGALDLIHKNETQKTAVSTLGQIQAAQSKGIDHTPILDNLKTTNPDAYDMIKDKVGTIKTPVKPKLNFAQLLAKAVKYGTGPGLIWNAAQQASKVTAPNLSALTKSVLDFQDALLSRE